METVQLPTQLFQINENDLGELERILPKLAEAMMPIISNRDRVLLRRCQNILSNVRWNYGPPSHVERIDTDHDDDS